jgi:hypothetical protein
MTQKHPHLRSCQPMLPTCLMEQVRKLPALVLVAALSVSLASAVIIDLGRNGQEGAGNTFRVTLLDTLVFEDTAGSPGDLAEAILERIRVKIDTHPSFSAVPFNDGSDPGRNAILVLRIGLLPDPEEPYSAAVLENDPNVNGAAIWYIPTEPRDKLTYDEVAAVNADGVVTLGVVLVNGGLLSHSISTVGKSAAQVNADMQSALTGNGFTVTSSGGTVEATMPGDQLYQVTWSHTDTGVSISSISAQVDTPPPPPPPGSSLGAGDPIPTVSEWGLLILVGLFGLVAVRMLRRRGQQGIS